VRRGSHYSLQLMILRMLAKNDQIE